MTRTYDAIVIGTGGVGSAALWHLARQGVHVLGLDRFPGGHDRGSSHGQSRVIRQAYFEHPDYVPLLKEAYRLWDDLEQASGKQVFHRTGLLEVGPPDGIVIPGVLTSARQHQLDIEVLTPAEARKRFPAFRIPDELAVVFECDAGYLLVEDAVRTHLSEAQRSGAELATDQVVTGWQSRPEGIEVSTEQHVYHTRKLVITAGAWGGELLAELQLPLRVVRKHLHWYASSTPDYHQQNGCPVFFFEDAGAFYYGFPQFDDRGLKIAEHSGGEVISDPLNDPRHVDPHDRDRVERFLRHYLPGVDRRATDHAVCFYTMTPDENFFVDRHPHDPNVVLAVGLSGHGFKFASLLGKVLSDLALEGKTRHPIDFLRLQRTLPSGAMRFH